MDEKTDLLNETAAKDPREVVLEYTPAQRPVVEYYRQPTPLPGRRAAAAPEPKENDGEEYERPRPRPRWARVMISCIALLTVVSLLLGILYTSGLLGPREKRSESSELERRGAESVTVPHNSSTKIPRYPNGDGTRVRYYSAEGEELSIQQIYARVNPSTVTVAVDQTQNTLTIGTGVIFTPDGYILTNAHVIAGGRSCTVILDTGYSQKARLVGMDEEKDLAVIKIDADGLPYAQFGDSDALVVGDPVYAIGNPLGMELRGTLTNGIVSAINRDVQVDGVSMTLIQTNAALNNGNSGGPLINAYGQVIGINTMKKGSTADVSVEGLGFAIPISSVAYMVNDLIAYGEIRGEPVMGITVLTQPVELPDGGAALEIQEVDPNGAGAKAGLRPGDYLTFAEDVPLGSVADLLRVRRGFGVGEAFRVEVLRGSERFTAEIVLQEGT